MMEMCSTSRDFAPLLAIFEILKYQPWIQGGNIFSSGSSLNLESVPKLSYLPRISGSCC